MQIKNILEHYTELKTQMKYGSLNQDVVNKIKTLEEMFVDQDFIGFEGDGMKIIRLYYKEHLTAEQIAELMYMSPRTVYRRRDKQLERLADVFDS